ncbi:tetratricopeptide repeat protein [Kibdelosporangium philippinense]|uniref:Tetratricopeptide repeat protein n=1 Tax=Kibdelosporangium philippinense TaxID=211113 RepID=A0ABS8ZDM1_9PSEU|nr:BTAD domain-containing putative transcriptional regulator [Kibdelosporangium philippinense]MCE7003927.1 tetratricopeptide repeat protein [Kibdelosporangium philippinense]
MRHDVRVLGTWHVHVDGVAVDIPAGQLRVLFTSLLLSANKPVRVDRLAEQLWPERGPASTRGSLHTYVRRLRKLLGSELIQTGPGGTYQLTIPTDAIDVHRFRDLLDQARTAKTETEELVLLSAALELWRGTPFEDMYSTWLDRDVIPRLTEEWFAATGRRIDLQLSAGASEQLIPELYELTAQYPARESLWLQLITALHRAGRRAEALTAYRQVRDILRDELGIEPSQRLVELQRRILMETDDTPASTSPRQLPHDIARFSGRAEELDALDELWDNRGNDGLVIISIDGAPGVGKTTIAIRWAHRIVHMYPDVQLYLNLRGYAPEGPVTPAAAAETLLRSLGVPNEVIPSGLDERSALLRSTLSGRRTLLFLDNARDAEQVRPLLPSTTALVIVTSRNQLRALSIRDGAYRLTLHRLAREQSLELLGAAIGQPHVAKDISSAGKLVELCDNLPLAIAIVAERALRAASLREVVNALEDEQARLDNLDTRDDNPYTSLRAALTWSYQALSAQAAAMFRKLGMYPGNDISLQTASALADMPQAQFALDQLVAAHLVEERQPGRYELHDLVRLYAAETAGQDTVREQNEAARRLLGWYLHTTTNADHFMDPGRHREFLVGAPPTTVPAKDFTSVHDAKAWFTQEYDSLRSVTAWAAAHGYPEYAWRIALNMTTFFDYAIPWDDGVEYYQAAHKAAKAAGEDLGEAYTLNSLGCVLLDMGKQRAAIPRFQASRTKFQALSNLRGTAMTTGNLGLAHVELAETDEAVEYTSQALELYERLGDNRGVCRNLDNLGSAYANKGEYWTAVECFQKAVALNHGSGHSDNEAWLLTHLGDAYASLKEYPRAIRAYRQAVDLFRHTGNGRHMAQVLIDLGTTLDASGHPGLARGIWERAVGIMTDLADPRADDLREKLAAFSGS